MVLNRNLKLMSCVLTAGMLSASMPVNSGLVYAGSMDKTAAEQGYTIDEAKSRLEEAESARDKARGEKEQADNSYNQAKTDYESAAADAQTKKSASEIAEETYNRAVSDTAAKKQAAEDASGAKETAQAASVRAAAALQEKRDQAAAAEQAVTEAGTDLQNKKSRWDGEKEQAAAALEAAGEELSEAGVSFINSKAGSSISDFRWLSWLRTNMAGKRNGSISWDSVLQTEGFEESFYSPYSYENLMRSADLVAEGNVLRKSDNPSLNELKISYKTMTAAIASNALSNYVIAHVLMNEPDYMASQIYRDSGRNNGENISWGASDPFMGWYYEEKIHYLADQAGGEGQANVTVAMVNSIIQEAERNGHNYLDYCDYYGYGTNASEIAEHLNDERIRSSYSTGHYTNLVSTGHIYTGLSTNSKSHIYRVCHVQEFGNIDMGEGVTPEQFKAELEEYAKPVRERAEAAKAAVEALKAEPDYYTAAAAAYSSAVNAKDEADAAVSAAESENTVAQQALNEASTALGEAEAAYSQAKDAEAAAKTAFDSAKAAYEAAAQKEQEKKIASDAAGAEAERAAEAYDKAVREYESAREQYLTFFGLEKAEVSALADKTYTGKALTQNFTVSIGGKVLERGRDYSVVYTNNTNAGTATVTITGSGSYSGTKKLSFKILKAKNTLSLKGKTRTVSYSKLRKKNQAVAAKDVFTVSGAKGKITCKKTSGNKNITVSNAGKITVKKGLKKGTYSVNIKVTAVGNKNYKSGSKSVTAKIKVK